MKKLKRQVSVGNIKIGANAPISVQSMTNTNTKNIEETSKQLQSLEAVGCDIARLAVVDLEAADCIKELKKSTTMPLVADIHFDYKVAIRCTRNGIDKVRINPGNIGSIDKVKEVVKACSEKNVPIRIGVNAGSLEKDILAKYGVCADAMVESAMRHIRILEDCNFADTVVSLKSSNVPMMIEAYRKLNDITDYPLHIGVTEAGTMRGGIIKSCIGIGSLLAEGIGNTLRVSLTANPVEEIKVGIEILKTLGHRTGGVEIVSCPTCSRCRINLIDIANEVEEQLMTSKKNIKVAIMGCAVNGPGEAKDADIGIAGGNGEGLIFKKGEIYKKVPEGDIVKALLDEIERM